MSATAVPAISPNYSNEKPVFPQVIIENEQPSDESTSSRYSATTAHPYWAGKILSVTNAILFYLQDCAKHRQDWASYYFLTAPKLSYAILNLVYNQSTPLQALASDLAYLVEGELDMRYFSMKSELTA